MLHRVARRVARVGGRGVATATSTSPKHPLLLYTAGTPNGHKASVFLEELKAVYGLEYECVALPICTHSVPHACLVAVPTAY